jgi:hypothetical protein
LTATGANLRESELVEFLAAIGWGAAQRTPLSADASTRRYERLRLDGQAAMLMDAPPLESPPCPPDADEAQRLALGWNAVLRLAASRVEAFAAVAGWLDRLGLSAPRIRAMDAPRGFCLLEDLGDDLFARVLERGEATEPQLYEAAARTLARVHRTPPPDRLPHTGGDWPVLAYDELALRSHADLFIEWMPRREPDMRINDANRLRWERLRHALTDRAAAMPRAYILRDTHAENLIWLPERDGLRKVGLLDFQDAILGWGEWDMSMLLHDARRDVSPEAREAATIAYLDETGLVRADFEERLALLGALNLMRIMGIFARLVVRDRKQRYDQFQPRLRRLLASALAHPELAEARGFVEATAPFLLADA